MCFLVQAAHTKMVDQDVCLKDLDKLQDFRFQARSQTIDLSLHRLFEKGRQSFPAASWVLNNTNVLGSLDYPRFSGPPGIIESKGLSLKRLAI